MSSCINRFTAAELEQAQAMKASGATLREISRRLNRNPASVAKLLRRGTTYEPHTWEPWQDELAMECVRPDGIISWTKVDVLSKMLGVGRAALRYRVEFLRGEQLCEQGFPDDIPAFLMTRDERVALYRQRVSRREPLFQDQDNDMSRYKFNDCIDIKSIRRGLERRKSLGRCASKVS